MICIIVNMTLNGNKMALIFARVKRVLYTTLKQPIFVPGTRILDCDSMLFSPWSEGLHK